MLGDYRPNEIVYQLATFDIFSSKPNERLDTDSQKVKLLVNDESGQARVPLEIDQKDFELQFRPWKNQPNVFVRTVKIIAIENDGKMIRFQRLDKNGYPIGGELLTQKKFFSKVYLLEHQINIG